MVKQLEVSLYRSAPSFEAYADKNTLKHRLQLLAMEIAKKTHPTGGDEHSSTAAGGDKHKDNASTGGSGGGGGGGNPSSVSRRPPPPQQQQQPPLPLPPQQQPPPRMGGYPPNHNGSGNARPGDILHGVGHRGPMNSPSMRMDQPPPPSMSNSMHTSWNRPRNSDQGTVHSRESSSSNKPSQVVNLGQINNMMSVPGPQPTPTVGSASLGNKNGPGSSGNSKASDKEWEVRIRHKQQRLLLLHHSSKCQNADGKCPVTPHCADMKRLWLHMAKCEDNRCTVPHCYSSRAILSHYRKCKDPECQACGPVRETVWKSRNNTRPKSGGLTPGDNQRMGLNSLMRGPGPPQQPQTLLPTSSSTKPPPLTASVPPPMSSNGSVPPQARKSPLQPSSVSSSSKVSEIDPKIKHKQQRLLLLRHASKCTAKDGECKKTPHCADMKRLWKHISECHDNKCKYPHCLSSRYVLMHYRKCKDALCPACAPVREIANQQQQQPPQLSQQPPPSQNPREKRARTESSGTTPSIEQKEIKPEPKQIPQYSSEEHSYSIMNNFTIEQIQLHLQSLKQTYMLPQKAMKEKCLSIMKTLHDHDHFWVFSKPVDPDELGLPDYFDVIKKPMDLGTVQKKLDSGQYHSISDFNCDIRLTFDNALTYNEPGSVVNDMATQMKQEYEKKYEALLENLQKEETDRMKNDRACALCGFEKLQFEPPVFFCNNLKCPSKRIRRNTHFYSGGNNQYNYCSQCYNDLDADMKLEMPDMTLKKADLKKKKNDEVHEENWVQCDECQRWIHQICGLFNSRQNKDSSCTYSCPKCLLEKRKKGTKPGKADSPTAEQLPRTKLSEWIEDYIEEKVKNQYKVLAKEKSEVEVSEVIFDHFGFWKNRSILREECLSFAQQKIPFEQAHQTIKASGKVTIRQVTSTDRKLEVREKMRTHYVHKNYPEEFPYRCKCLLVFQNIDGADVILFALYVYEHGADNPKPNQRTVYISYLDSVHFMRPRRLRTFVYHEILIGYLEYARRSGFAKAHIWACPPLKGDDYIFYAKPEDQKTPKDKMLTKWYIDMLLECQNRSIVGKVTNMYDLYFAPGLFDATAVPYLEGDYFSSEIESIIKEIEEGGKNGTTGKKNKKKKGGDKKSKSKNNRKGTRSGGLDETAVLLAETAVTGSGVIRDPVMVKLGDRIKDMKQSFIVAFLNWDGASPEDKEVPQSILDERQRRKLIKEEPEKGSSKKRDLNGNVKSEAKKNNNIIDDDSEEISAEIFDTRQDFLNLCKGNHYQFDAPRRAKHTSMMVLWHLHNKSAAKFVHVCIHCSKEILTGFRYTCQVCTDVDLCSDCFKKRKDIPNLCKHPLVPKAVEPESSQSGSGSNSNLTEAQRRERKRNINLHIKLLEHASTCPNPKCGSSNCAKMKQYLKHSQVCKVSSNLYSLPWRFASHRVSVSHPLFTNFVHIKLIRKRCLEDVKFVNASGHCFDTMHRVVRTEIAQYLSVEPFAIVYGKLLSSNKRWTIVVVI